jgi:PEGA domain
MAALVIGLSIGFAGGYGIGTTREHPVAAGSETQPAQAQASVPPATEMPVAPAPAAVPPATTAPVRPTDSRPRDHRSSPTPERRNARSEPSPSRQAPQQARPSAAVPTGTSGQFIGRLSVDSRPVGARVFLDNKQIGVTPLALPSIPAGEHAIRLERDGYRHWTSTVRVIAGEQNRVTASLDR